MTELLVRKGISGCQIGADEGGLRAFRQLGLETGGYIPRGGRTANGQRPDLVALYGLTETPEWGYQYRTRLNVEHSDGTVRFAYDFDSAGERLTLRCCRQLGKPHYDIVLTRPGYDPMRNEWDGETFEVWAHGVELIEFPVWLHRNRIKTLNVAGNAHAGIAPVVANFLVQALTMPAPAVPANDLATSQPTLL